MGTKIKAASSSALQMAFYNSKQASAISSAKAKSAVKIKGSTLHSARFDGGVPTTDWQQWCDSTRLNPVPISFRLRSISSLIRLKLGKSDLADKVDKFVTQTRIKKCKVGETFNKANGRCVPGQCPAGWEATKEAMHKEKKNKLKKKKKKVVVKFAKSLCRKCPRGKFNKAKGSYCVPCAKGKYQDEEGKATCKKCKGERTSDPGSERCKYLNGWFEVSFAGTEKKATVEGNGIKGKTY